MEVGTWYGPRSTFPTNSFEDLATVHIRYNGPTGAMEYTVDGVPQAAPGGVLEISVDPLDGHMVEMIPAAGFTAADMQIMGNGKVGSNTFPCELR